MAVSKRVIIVKFWGFCERITENENHENSELLFLLSSHYSKIFNPPIVAVLCKSVSETYFHIMNLSGYS